MKKLINKKLTLLSAILFLGSVSLNISYAEDGHNHGKDTHEGHDHSEGDSHNKAKKKKYKKHEGHGEKEKHKEHDDHDGHDDHKDSKDKKGKESHDDHSHGKNESDAHDEAGHTEEHNHAEGGHSNEEGHDEHGSSFGKDKAIIAVEDEGGRFQLNPESIERIGIKFSNIQKNEKKNIYSIPKKSLVEFQDKVGVYVVRNNWIQLVSVKILTTKDDLMNISSEEILSNDQIVTSETGMVRIAHLQASGQGGKGHAH